MRDCVGRIESFTVGTILNGLMFKGVKGYGFQGVGLSGGRVEGDNCLLLVSPPVHITQVNSRVSLTLVKLSRIAYS